MMTALSAPWLIAVNATAWLGIHLGAAWLGTHLPIRLFDSRQWLYRARA